MLEINYFTKIFMRLAPQTFLRYAARQQRLDARKITYATKLFSQVERVDIHPLSSYGGRGFMICLNRELALFFYQDGDHFYFDGLEIGEYEKGNVAIFDRLRD